MATVKAILRNKPNKEGLLPLVIRIIKDRKASEIYLGYHLKKDDWDAEAQRVRKSYPNSTRLNNLILKKLSDATAGALELEANKTHVSAHAVKQKVKPTSGSTFFAQSKVYLDNLKAGGKYNQYTADKPRIKHFREFVGHDIAFQDITISMLERFKNYLKGLCTLGERSIQNHMVAIRSVFSQAKKDNLIDEKFYPFGKGKMKIKFPETTKVGLNSQEIQTLETVTLDAKADHCRDMWLMSYYFAGVRISDVMRLRWSDFQDGRLYYVMGKNDKSDSLKISEKAVKIIEKYRVEQKDKDDFIFPELKGVDLSNDFITQRTIAFKTSAIDKVLKKLVAPAANIEKKLTSHISRRSFAQNAVEIDVRILQRLFRHTKLETTIGYMGNFKHNATDDALDAVLNNSLYLRPVLPSAKSSLVGCWNW